MEEWYLLLAAAGVSGLLTGLLRRYALARSLLDTPNSRSSHVVPTPRGGGVAIVVTFCLMLPIWAVLGNISWAVSWALLLAGGGVAIIGFMDDHGHIAARWRLLGHFSAALVSLYFLNGIPPFQIVGVSWDLGWFGGLLFAFYLVWLLKLYNFMDGIDGLASLQAIFVCVGGALLYWLNGQLTQALLPLSLAFAVFGFLFWNFPPAKIFMGDAGSGFLGIVLGILSIHAMWMNTNFFWAWLVLLGVFIVDATYTLIRRLLRGDKVYEAHRSHAYQYASRYYGKHAPVTIGVTALNVIWLLPIALLVGSGSLEPLMGIVIAYVPLVFLAVRFKAGKLESSAQA